MRRGYFQTNRSCLALVALCVSYAAAAAQQTQQSAEELSKQAHAYYERGYPDSALTYLLRAAEVLRSQGRTADEAVTFNNLALIYENTGQPQKAIELYRRSLSFWRTSGDRGTEAATLNSIALVYARFGQRDSALVYFRAALPIWSAVADGQREAETLTSIGGVYLDTGKPDSALAYFRAALPIERAIGDRFGEAATFNRIALLFDLSGHRDSALFYYRAALPVNRVDETRLEEATSLDGISLVYDHLGRRDSALAYLRQALPIWRALHHREGEAKVLTSMAVIFAQIGQPDSALSYYRAALPIWRAIGGNPGEGRMFSNLAGLFGDMGRPDSALHYYRGALSIMRAAGDKGGEGLALSNIGMLYALMGRRDSVSVYNEAALRLLRAAHDKQSEARTLSNLGAFFASEPANAANRLRSLAYYDTAAAILARLRSQSGSDVNAIAFGEVERGTFLGWARAWIHFSGNENGSSRDIVSALAVAERGRAQGLRDLLAQRRADESSRLSGLAATDTLPGGDLFTEAIEALEPVRKSGVALLYYLLAQDSLHLWILDPGGEIRLMSQRALPADSLVQLVLTIRRSVGAGKARGAMLVGATRGNYEQEPLAMSRGVDDEEPDSLEVESATRVLSQNLLPTDLLRVLPVGSEIVIVPHGILGLLPFAALRIPQDTLPLGVRFALRYSPSLRAIASDARPAPPKFDLIVGDPEMPTVTNASGSQVRLRDLPAARAEGAAVARRLGARLLTGQAASETTVREQMPTARLVHLATHGFAFGTESRVRDSYVALAPDSRNDGLLTIGEFLDSVGSLAADLVVLSACQTGLGDLKHSEGTVGFQRAFLAKGARTVLVSLWSVDDKATALLMDRFYTHWLGSGQAPLVSKAEALRRAENDVRTTKEYASPKYWAAFQLVGAQ